MFVELMARLRSLGHLVWVTAMLSAWANAALAQSASTTAPDTSAVAQPESLLPEDGVLVAIPGAQERPLTLEACVQNALSANDALQAQRQVRGELEGQKLVAQSEGMPSLDLKGSFQRGRDPSFALDSIFAGDPNSGFPLPSEIPAQTFWRTSADLWWELNPLLVINALKTANVALDENEQETRDIELRTAEDAMTAYYRVILAYAQLRSLGSEIEARQEFVDITIRRYHLDMATPLDTLQARVQLANLLPAQRRNEQDLRNSGIELNRLMGRDPRQPVAIQVDFQLEDADLNAQRAVQMALQRPDVLSIQLAEERLKKERSTIGANMRPYLTMTGSYGFVARNVENMFDEGHDWWAARVALTVPIFDGQETKGRKEERTAAIRRTQHEISGTRRRAEQEALTSLGELEIARENMAAAELNMSQAQQALEQTNLRYTLGRSSYLELLNAQSARFVARTNLIEATYDVLVWTTTLKRAMGVSPTTPLAEAMEVMP